MPGRYPKFPHDHGLAEMWIGATEFLCIGVSTPVDHPHVYINMGDQDVILCPYCATAFRLDLQLGPFAADPPECVYFDPETAA